MKIFFAENDHEYVQKGNNLHMYVNMGKKYIISDEQQLLTEAEKFAAVKCNFVIERIVDISTGEVKSFKPILTNPFEKLDRAYHYTTPENVIFEYSNGKKMRIVFIARWFSFLKIIQKNA